MHKTVININEARSRGKGDKLAYNTKLRYDFVRLLVNITPRDAIVTIFYRL